MISDFISSRTGSSTPASQKAQLFWKHKEHHAYRLGMFLSESILKA